MQYIDFHGPFDYDYTVTDIAAAIARNDPEEMVYVPLAVSMAPLGRIWGEHICLKLSTHQNPGVRGNALEGLGHLARIYRYLNRRLVEPAIIRGLNDDDDWVCGKALNALDDIEWFIGWVLPGREESRLRPVCRRRGH